MEAGGFDYSPKVQEAYQGIVIGDPYYDLAIAGLRYFGGTSGHWAAGCRPLDEVDFEPRAGFKNSGWPIRKEELDFFVDDANTILELEPLQPDEPSTSIGKKYISASVRRSGLAKNTENTLRIQPQSACLYIAQLPISYRSMVP